MAGGATQKATYKRAHIEEFPQDQSCWWIRWVDGYQHAPLGTLQPMVRVHLERLSGPLHNALSVSAGTAVMQASEAAQSDSFTTPVFVGNTPELAIGSVYHQGVRAGEIGGRKRWLSFDLSEAQPRIVPVDEAPSQPPAWWKQKYAYRWVNRSEYRIPERGSYGLLLENPTYPLRLLIPCQEIFRFFYARESKLARALLSGPWASTMEQVVNTERTLVRPDGVWQVVLRNGMHNASVMHAGNLTLHTEGFSAAKAIFSSISQQHKGFWHMQATIPFAPHRLRLQVRFLDLPYAGQRTALCTRILAANWPHPNPIHYIRENDPSGGKKQIETTEVPPFTGPKSEFSSLDDWHATNASSEDPSSRGPVVTHPISETGWRAKPQLVEMTKAESKRYRRRPPEVDSEALSTTSTRQAHYGASEAAPGSFVQSDSPSEHLSSRFAKAIELFKTLKGRGDLLTWRAHLPAGASDRYVMEGVPVCPLPPKALNERGAETFRPWTIVDKSIGRPRCVLIVKFIFGSGGHAFWLEVEPSLPARADECEDKSPTKGFRSLILRPAREIQTSDSMLWRALYLCVQHRAIWPEDKRIISATRAASATTWVHHHLSDEELNPDSATRKIDSILPRTRHP